MTGRADGGQYSPMRRTRARLTAIDIRQMEQSDVLMDAASESFGLPKLRRRLCVDLLRERLAVLECRTESALLEIVQSLLPPSVAFYPNFDATKYHLFTAAEIYSELNDIAIVDRPGL